MKNTKNLNQDVYIFPDYLTRSEDEVWSTYLQDRSRLFLFELPGHKKNYDVIPIEFSKFVQSLEKKIIEDSNKIVIIATGLSSVLALELAFKYQKKIRLCILISPILTESKFKLFLFRFLHIFHWFKKEKFGFFQLKAIFSTKNIYTNLVKKIPLLKNLLLDTKTIFLFSGKKSYLNDFETKNSIQISKNARVIRFRNSTGTINRNDWRFKRLIFELIHEKENHRK